MVEVANPHNPRLWIEKDEEENQAVMVAFYPQFQMDDDFSQEFLFLFGNYTCEIFVIDSEDLSLSMKGQPLEDMKRHALIALNHLPENSCFNLMCFGSTFEPFFQGRLSCYLVLIIVGSKSTDMESLVAAFRCSLIICF